MSRVRGNICSAAESNDGTATSHRVRALEGSPTRMPRTHPNAALLQMKSAGGAGTRLGGKRKPGASTCRWGGRG
eukprot:3429359-Rhodomonas_salina.3